MLGVSGYEIDPMARTDSRAFNWYVLFVPPQRERAAQSILDGEGFATFVPVAREMKFANGAARGRREKTAREIPIMPRYVFIGMNETTPGWGRVFCYTTALNARRRKIINGVIGANGEPCKVPHAPLRRFMLRHNSGEFNAPAAHGYMQTGREFGVGDMVTTEDEMLAGQVIEIAGRHARVLLEIFGGKCKAQVPLEKLVVVR